jgi:hypothetical protein
MGQDALDGNWHIFFEDGWYNDQTAPGLALIAHELMHVQQMQANGEKEFNLNYLVQWATSELGVSEFDFENNAEFIQETARQYFLSNGYPNQ